MSAAADLQMCMSQKPSVFARLTSLGRIHVRPPAPPGLLSAPGRGPHLASGPQLVLKVISP